MSTHDESQPPASASPNTLPYRHAERTAAPAVAPSPRRERVSLALAALATAAGLALAGRLARRGAAAPEVPPIWRDNVRRLPSNASLLRPSVPLAPLLASDAPEGLALLEPAEGGTRLGRGDALRVRFNRPMVPGARVSHPLAETPLRFSPPLRGSAHWDSRSTLAFEPEASEWTRTHEVTMTVDPALRSLADEVVGEIEPRTVVLDATPHLSGSDSPRRVSAGSPLRLAFDGPADVGALSHELMAYEIGGGERAISFSLARAGRDETGHDWVDVRLARALEPGARVALVAAPMLFEGGGESPERLDFEFEPRPKFEGIDCPVGTTSASDCTYQGPPGRVVDVGEALRLRASVSIESASAHVSVVPALPAMVTEVMGPLLSVRGEWAPGQVYELRVDGARSVDGDPIARPAALAVRSAGLPPAVQAPGGRLVFERDDPAPLHLTAVHVDRGEVRYAVVRPGEEFPAALVPDALRALVAPRTEVRPLAPLVPDARANRWGRGNFLWTSAVAGRDANMALVEFRASPESGSVLSFVQRTDLGLTARLLDRGILVWVTSLATGRAVPGAEVTIGQVQRGPVASARTDGDGVAWIDLPAARRNEDEALAVRATSADDRAVLLLDPRTAVRAANFGLAQGESARPADAPVATVFTDRGLYRAGDTVHAAVVARAPGEGGVLRAPRQRAVTLRVAPAGDPVALAEVHATLDAFGAAAGDLVLPASVGEGELKVEAVFEGATGPAGSADVRVAEYRDPAMRVDLAMDPHEATAGDARVSRVSARYLFGAAASGASLHWTLTREPGASYPARWEAYAFAPDATSPRASTVDSGDATLDAAGAGEIRTAVHASTSGRETETLEVEVSDASGQTTSARRSVVTYPAGYEVGLRRGPAWLPAGSALDVDAVVIAHDGTTVPGRSVSARIVREGWTSYWEWVEHAHDDAAGAQGGYRARRARESEQVHDCDLVSGAEPVHCAITPARPGVYLLEVETRDESGRSSTASRRVYVAGPGDRPDRDPPGTAVTLTPERAALSVGQRARVAFESPFPDAEALITVEREGVMHTERRRVGPGGNVIEFETTAAMVPNAFVSLALVRPRTAPPANGVDPGAPDLRLGAAEISVRPQARPIAITLDVPHGPSRPDQDVTVEAELRDDDGRPVRGEVTLYAVDEGTLRLTSYSVPDATNGLYPRRAPSFAVEDLRRSLASREEPAVTLPGGDGSEGSSSTPREERERFEPTVLWRPHLRSDERGRVRAAFHLPNRSTQYRIMAVAVDNGARSGRASETLVVRRDVVLRPALPRFVTEGDRFEAAVFVHNAGESPADVTVVPETNRARMASQSVHLAPGEESRVAVTAEAHGNSLAVRFAVQGDGGDVTSATVPVLARAHGEHGMASGAVRGATDLTVALPDGTVPRDGALALEVSNQPTVGARAAVESVGVDAFTGTAGAAASLLATSIALCPGPECAARSAAAIARLEQLQAADGSFGHWSSVDAGDPLSVALAAHALELARTHGTAVPDGLRQRALSWLSQSLASGALSSVDEASRDGQALALRALAEAGRPDAARVAELFERRESLSVFASAQLGLSLAPNDLRRITLAQRTGRLVATRGGDPRALGPALELVSSTDGALLYARTAASLLLGDRRAGAAGWQDAESTALALEGLTEYARRFAASGPMRVTVSLDGRVVAPTASTTGAATYALPFDRWMSGEHRVHLDAGGGTVFYALAGRWNVALGDADRIARGERVALHRVVETAAGAPLGDGAHVRMGDLVRVRLFVYAEQEPPPDVTVLDRLGGGFEAVDDGLDTTPQDSLAALLGGGVDDEESVDPRGFYANRSLGLITHRAFGSSATAFCLSRADAGLREFTYGVRATTVGTFVLPPAELSAERDADYVARSTMLTLTVDP